MRTMRRILPLLALFLAVAPARAQAKPPQPGWSFTAAPYLWAIGIDGSTRIGRLPAIGVEASFSDLVEVLDFGLMANFEARHGHWGYFGDAVYTALSDDGPAPNPAFGNVAWDLTTQVYSFGAAYRVHEGGTQIDVLAGARYTDQQVDLALSGGLGSGRRVSESQTWWNGYIGERVRFHPTERWMISLYGDLGAGDSDFTWQLAAGAGYAFNDLIALGFGYRYLDDDYENDSFAYDMAMAGPYLGVAFRW